MALCSLAGGARETTADGLETFVATNCLGPHLLTLLLLPHLRRSAEVRDHSQNPMPPGMLCGHLLHCPACLLLEIKRWHRRSMGGHFLMLPAVDKRMCA